MEKTNGFLGSSGIRMSLFLLGIVSLLLLANTQSVVGNKHQMLPSDQAISYKFKYLIGSNRFNEFKMLENLIKPTSSIFTVSNTNVNDLQGSFASSESDIVFLLGRPDIKISNTIYQYNLGEENSVCHAIIEFNEKSQVVSVAIKSCK